MAEDGGRLCEVCSGELGLSGLRGGDIQGVAQNSDATLGAHRDGRGCPVRAMDDERRIRCGGAKARLTELGGGYCELKKESEGRHDISFVL